MKNPFKIKKNLTDTLNSMVKRLLDAAYDVAKMNDLTAINNVEFYQRVLDYLKLKEEMKEK